MPLEKFFFAAAAGDDENLPEYASGRFYNYFLVFFARFLATALKMAMAAMVEI